MLPNLPFDVPKNQAETVAVRGVNYSDRIRDGDLAESENLTTRRWPYLSVRRAREEQAKYSGSTAIFAWEKLVTVQGTELMFDGQPKGTVLPGLKQFAAVGTRLIIWPDKLCVELKNNPYGITITEMEIEIESNDPVFTTDSLNLPNLDVESLKNAFRVGDLVEITTSTGENSGQFTIKSISGTELRFGEGSFQKAKPSGEILIRRVIPDMDFICASENRLWGCSSRDRSIYASALGDPIQFYDFSGLSTDSYALPVGTEGNFTGCCRLGNAVLFFKEHTLHKVLGSYPAEYSMYDYQVEGLQKGSYRSLQVINETLYYMGLHGVYTYSGSTPVLISQCFGSRRFSDAVGGSDGERYYLSVKEGDENHLLVFDTSLGIWLREDSTRCLGFSRVSERLYFLDDKGRVWLEDSGEEDKEIRWSAQFTPFYETLSGRKRHTRLLIRLELPKGSWVRAEIRSGQRWEVCGQAAGAVRDTVALRLPIRRCDRFELRLTGKGPCAILGIQREFVVGSERG